MPYKALLFAGAVLAAAAVILVAQDAGAAARSYQEAEDLVAHPSAETLRKALEKYEEALAGFRAAGDRMREGLTLSKMCRDLEMQGQLRKAVEHCEQSLAVQRAIGDSGGQAESLNQLGILYGTLGDAPKSGELHRLALEIARAMGDRKVEAMTLNNLANYHGAIGERQKAIDYLTLSMAMRRELGDRAGLGVVLSNLANQNLFLGEYQKAVEQHLESLAIRREFNDRRGEALVLGNLGADYAGLGDQRRALEYHQQSLRIWQAVGDRKQQSTQLGNAAVASRKLGDYAAAAKYFEQALALRREDGDPALQASVLINLATIADRLGESQKAVKYHAEAMALYRSVKDRYGEALALHHLGEIHGRMGDAEKSLDYSRQSLPLLRSLGSRDWEAKTLTNIARVERDRGNLTEARSLLADAGGIYEGLRSTLVSPELRASYRASREDHYALYMDVSMRSGEPELALERTEKSRARSLVEMLSESKVDLRQDLSAAERGREDALVARVTTVQKELFRPGTLQPRQQELKKDLAESEGELDRFQLELRRNGSRYATVQYADVLDVPRIRRELLDEDTALVEYALGDKQSYVWAVTQKAMSTAVLPGRQQIEQALAAYRKALTERASALTVTAALARADAGSRALYRMLFAPVDAAVKTSRRLIVVPDGALAYLPFETLLGEKRLLERYSIAYAPSASALSALRSNEWAGARSLLAFGDPVYEKAPSAATDAYTERGFSFTQLPNTRSEVTAIRSLFPEEGSRVYLGAEAREQRLKSEPLERYRYLHFATHGYLDEQSPGRSGIVLSLGMDPGEDGVLQMNEIMRLRLNAEMVTLSACQTGLGKILNGEGVIGLTRAFLYAGAQSVVVSLWNVNDGATAELMKTFYGNLKAGMAKDEALRQAKLKLMRSEQRAWRHPYYWAPFVFVGRPR